MEILDRKRPNLRWKKKPTFFPGQEKEICSTDPEPEPEKTVVMKPQEIEDRTPVKARVQQINKKSSGSPAKVPDWKQVKLAHYFGRKSPKASRAGKLYLRLKLNKTRGPRAPFQENLVCLGPV